MSEVVRRGGHRRVGEVGSHIGHGARCRRRRRRRRRLRDRSGGHPTPARGSRCAQRRAAARPFTARASRHASSACLSGPAPHDSIRRRHQAARGAGNATDAYGIQCLRPAETQLAPTRQLRMAAERHVRISPAKVCRCGHSRPALGSLLRRTRGPHRHGEGPKHHTVSH
jgi:hypothetical protein